MNLFGDSDYLEKLSSKGDPLERLEKVVDFECFRPTRNQPLFLAAQEGLLLNG